MPEFCRLAVVNRGEAAMRAINAVTELNRAGETRIPITSIAVHTHADRGAWFVREADERVCLGAETPADRADGRRKSAYLDVDRLMATLRAARADSVWVGWGCLEEHDGIAEACELAGMVFIGPTSATLRLLDDRVAARRLAAALGLPVADGAAATVQDRDASGDRAADSTPGRSEGSRRQVEVQVVADALGNTWAVGVRDCSLRRGDRKLLTESRCTALGPAREAELREAAVRLCQAANYSSVGSVEFLLDPGSGRFEFVQFNTHLQLEHPVTEVTTGIDLVKLQIQLALGLRLSGEPPASWGHAVEAVVSAEDPERGFEPAPGRIAVFRPPAGAGLRVDTGVAAGDLSSDAFEAPIAKIVAWGRDRAEAMNRLERALAQCAVIIDGGATNRSFLLSLLGHPEVRASSYDNRWLERLVAKNGHVPPPHPVALLHAAVEAYDAEQAIAQDWFYATAVRGRPEIPRSMGHQAELRYRGATYHFTVLRLGPRDYRVETAQGRADVQVDRFGPFESRLTCRGRVYHVLSTVSRAELLVEIDGVTHAVTRDPKGDVRGRRPGLRHRRRGPARRQGGGRRPARTARDHEDGICRSRPVFRNGTVGGGHGQHAGRSGCPPRRAAA